MKERISLHRLKFRSLVGWKINVVNREDNGVFTHCKDNSRIADISRWSGDEPEPDDYIVHELLHVAIHEITRASKRNHDTCSDKECKCYEEEELVQDICKLLKEGWPG